MDAFGIGFVLGELLAGMAIGLLTWVAVLLHRLCRAIEAVGRSPGLPEPGSPLDPGRPYEPPPPELETPPAEPESDPAPATAEKARLLARHLEATRRVS